MLQNVAGTKLVPEGFFGGTENTPMKDLPRWADWGGRDRDKDDRAKAVIPKKKPRDKKDNKKD
jgi:hypothetical protein